MGSPGGTGQQSRRSRIRRRRLRRLARLRVLCAALLVGVWGRAPLAGARRPIPPRRAVPIVAPYPDPPGIVLHSSLPPGKVHGIPIDAEGREPSDADDRPQWAATFEGKVCHSGYHYVILPGGT